MSKNTTYLWRDKYDPDQIHIGTGFYNKTLRKMIYTMWGTIFVDGIYEIFELSYENFEKITETPTKVDLKLDFYEEE